MDSLDLPACAVSIESGYAVQVAREYVKLVEAQMSRAGSTLHARALAAYESFAIPDRADYELQVADAERKFSEDYRPILRFTEVVYLSMVLETYLTLHVNEIQRERQVDRDVLHGLKRKLSKQKPKRGLGFVELARVYFQECAGWPLLSDDDWEMFHEIAELRNCIVHHAGIGRDSSHPEIIDRLERRTLERQTVGIEITRFDDGRDAGLPIEVHRRFIDNYLTVSESQIAAGHSSFYKDTGLSPV